MCLCRVCVTCWRQAQRGPLDEADQHDEPVARSLHGGFFSFLYGMTARTCLASRECSRHIEERNVVDIIGMAVEREHRSTVAD